jgi:hypothetical protein
MTTKPGRWVVIPTAVAPATVASAQVVRRGDLRCISNVSKAG